MTYATILAERLKMRIDAILERDGSDDAAVTGPGIGISYLFATELYRALTQIDRVPLRGDVEQAADAIALVLKEAAPNWNDAQVAYDCALAAQRHAAVPPDDVAIQWAHKLDAAARRYDLARTPAEHRAAADDINNLILDDERMVQVARALLARVR